MHRTVQVDKLKHIVEAALDADKASDIATIDLAGKSSLADYMIVATGLSQKHILALAESMVEKLEELGFSNVPVDSRTATDWIVVDAGALIIHIFRKDARSQYNLEKMWSVPTIAEVAM